MDLPTELPVDLQAKLDDLRLQPAAAFGRRYMAIQVDTHQDALNLHARYANVGDGPALKAFAAKTAPMAQEQLDRARSIRDGLV